MDRLNASPAQSYCVLQIVSLLELETDSEFLSTINRMLSGLLSGFLKGRHLVSVIKGLLVFTGYFTPPFASCDQRFTGLRCVVVRVWLCA